MDEKTRKEEIERLGRLDDIVSELANGEYVISTIPSVEEAKQIRNFIDSHKEQLKNNS